MIPQLIIFSGLLIGSVTDLKKREVPDTLNYSLIALGLFLSGVLAILNRDYNIMLSSVVGLFVGFIIGAVFYYSGQWGGGDAKLVMGVGALMGLNINTMFVSFPLFLVFIITALVAGAIYGSIWLLSLALINRRVFSKKYVELSSKNKNKSAKILIIVVALLLLALLLFDVGLQIIILGYLLLIFFALMIYSKNVMRAIELSVLIKSLSVDKLVEGDWVVDSFKFKNVTFKSDRTGITQAQIDLLKKNGVKKVLVKEGIPFVPSFFIAYIVILVLGNWFLLL